MLHSLTVGGAEVLAARLARNLRDRYRFVFACLDGLGSLGETLQAEGSPVEVFGRRPGIDLCCTRQLAQFWRRESVSLVHAHQYTPFFYCMAARGWRRRPPVLFTEHGRWFPDYPRYKRILFNRLVLRKTDRVVGVGKAVRQALISNEGIPAGRVGVIYNGVEMAAFNGQPLDCAAVRAEMGVDRDAFIILQVARLDHLKDHRTAVRTIARVARRHRRAQLVLVGEGPELENIEREIVAQGAGGHVRLLGLRNDVPRLLKAADVFLLTSLSEGIPVTIIEAMAAGVPVVSTSVGGVPEILADRVTGLLAPAGDDRALAEAIGLLAGDEALRQSIATSARGRARDVFSEQQMHAEYERQYLEMLAH